MPLPVGPRRGPRLGLGGALAVVAMGALLAAGFGVLGGRPSPSPSPPVGAVATSRAGASEPAPTPGTAATPQVTPFSACAAAPTSPPQVELQVNGQRTRGFVEVLAWRDAPSPSPAPSETLQAFPPMVSVPVDVITELWIVGGACAPGWNIGIIGNQDLASFVNPKLDPAIAAQNRFGLALAPFGGRDLNLRADLFFPTLIARATWLIRVEPFERPVANLQNLNDPQELVEGCDIDLVLGNGYQYPRDPTCTGDLPFEPRDSLEIDRDARLEFGLGDWDLQGAVLTCGHLSGTSFIAEPEPGCFLEATGRSTPSTSVTFPELPRDLESGEWTLAISACAISGGSLATNVICGTWYANVEIGP